MNEDNSYVSQLINLIKNHPEDDENYHIDNGIFIFNIPVCIFVKELNFNINTLYTWNGSKEETTLIKVGINNKNKNLVNDLTNLGIKISDAEYNKVYNDEISDVDEYEYDESEEDYYEMEGDDHDY